MSKRIDFPAPRGALPRAIPCRACGRPILFWPTAAGRRQPLDVDSAIDDPANPVAVRLESHFARCKSADRFRRNASSADADEDPEAIEDR